MSNVNVTQSNRIGFCTLLAIAFIVLKLIGYIGWSWWWVLAPIWIPACFWLVVVAICFAVAMLIPSGRRTKWRS